MRVCPKQVVSGFGFLCQFAKAKQTSFITYYTFNIVTDRIHACYVKQKEIELKHNSTPVLSPFKMS